MTTLDRPVFSFSGTLDLSLASKRRLSGHILAAPPAFRVVKAVVFAVRFRPVKHTALSRALREQGQTARRCSSWSRA